MIWKTISRIIVALLLVALMVAPIGTLYYISALEQEQYLPKQEEQIVLEELAYGESTEILRMDMAERVTLSGTVISTKVIYEELKLENISQLRLLISTGQVLQSGDLIGYLDGQEVRATKTGIIRSINRGSDPPSVVMRAFSRGSCSRIPSAYQWKNALSVMCPTAWRA